MGIRKRRQIDPEFEEFYIDADEPVFTSGVICRLLDIPVWVLKQLDAEGVVSPPRQQNCSRMYSKRELKTLDRVWRYMREEKVNVPSVKVIIRMEMKIENLEGRDG